MLLKYGALIDKPMSAVNNKITPLIMVTQTGNMALVQFLIKNGAKIARPGLLFIYILFSFEAIIIIIYIYFIHVFSSYLNCLMFIHHLQLYSC